MVSKNMHDSDEWNRILGDLNTKETDPRERRIEARHAMYRRVQLEYDWRAIAIAVAMLIPIEIAGFLLFFAFGGRW